MKIAQALNDHRPCFSFEFFPRNEEGMAQLMETIARLRLLSPTFVSVTYGAGGSTRARTLELVTPLQVRAGHRDHGPPHLRRVVAGELRETLDRLAGAGIENIMALRGDLRAGRVRSSRSRTVRPTPPT